MSASETILQKLEKFKIIISIIVIVVPIIGSAVYYAAEQTFRASRFIEKLQGVDASELANTLDWMELEILRIRYAEMANRREKLIEASNMSEDRFKKILNEHVQILTNDMKSNLDRQEEIILNHKERVRNKS